jgi:hypothetical protein
MLIRQTSKRGSFIRETGDFTVSMVLVGGDDQTIFNVKDSPLSQQISHY